MTNSLLLVCQAKAIDFRATENKLTLFFTSDMKLKIGEGIQFSNKMEVDLELGRIYFDWPFTDW